MVSSASGHQADAAEEIDRLKAHVEAQGAVLPARLAALVAGVELPCSGFNVETNTICSKSNAARTRGSDLI